MGEGGVTLETAGGEVRLVTPRYRLTFAANRPFVYLDDAAGRRVAELFVLSSVHPLDGRDDTTSTGSWVAQQGGREGDETSDEVTLTLTAGSTVWERKTYRFHCFPSRFVYDMVIEGQGRLAEVNYFGGYSSAWPRWGSGFFLSGHAFQQGFNPEPNVTGRSYFDPMGGTVVDLMGAPLPGKRHWFFNPPPFFLAFQTEGGWTGWGVEVEPGENRFTEYRYQTQDGFYFSLSYEGHTEVRGVYRLPGIGVDFAESELAALERHVTALRDGRMAPVRVGQRSGWWTRPIFCGWGAQCQRAAAEHGYVATDPEHPDRAAFLATMRYAPDYARQDVYEGFLATLAGHGLHPGTVVLDDKWQLTYGENRADPDKWPDLRGFVAQRHAEGQKVLLWLKAWDREGVPEEECVRNGGGLPLTVDPTSPAYERRLRAAVRRMVAAEGYDADGFKIDFSHRIPSGPGLCTHGEVWGMELLKRYLAIIHDEAKAVKPDALIVTHTPHPYLGDVLDMIRLNDMVDLTRADDGRNLVGTMRLRASVAQAALPGVLIDTDNWPVPNKKAWREYVQLQVDMGVPALYYASCIDLTQEPLDDDDYHLIRKAWACDRSG